MKKFLFLMLLFVCSVAIAADAGPTTVQFTATDGNGVTISPDAKATKMAAIVEANRVADSIRAANPLPFARKGVADEPADPTFKDFLTAHWFAILIGLLGLYELYARWTVTETDNTILGFITRLLNAIVPNRLKT